MALTRARVRGSAQPGTLGTRSVVCVSHGFQTNYERAFCNALAGAGADVTLISSDATDRAALVPAVRTINLRGSQDSRRSTWTKAVNLLAYHARLVLRTPAFAGRTVHVIGNIDPPLVCGVVEGLWFRLWCRRYVLTVHDLLPHGRHNAFNRVACRWSYRIASRLVVHTDRMKRELVSRFGVSADKVVVMQHGIEPHALGVRHEDPPARGAPRILFFGKVVAYKGVDLLLAALRDVSFDFQLTIAGADVDRDHGTMLRRAIEQHPRRDRIEWHDRFIGESEIEALFRSADLLALPYRHIDQSGVLFQALRFGVPIVATRVGSFEEYVSDEVGEMAEPDAADLTVALERWNARRSHFSRDRIREIGRRYEWPVTVLAVQAAYA